MIIGTYLYRKLLLEVANDGTLNLHWITYQFAFASLGCEAIILSLSLLTVVDLVSGKAKGSGLVLIKRIAHAVQNNVLRRKTRSDEFDKGELDVVPQNSAALSAATRVAPYNTKFIE
ncbi:hypothetical protein HK105_203123 [Polyrhizophydium stewartii]|uniref:Uncharacterized protein n=1 Tax=Polyrhizophydium stewartii TaxID=2732419 RepID=A0ABR4ND84_9FUNG